MATLDLQLLLIATSRLIFVQPAEQAHSWSRASAKICRHRSCTDAGSSAFLSHAHRDLETTGTTGKNNFEEVRGLTRPRFSASRRGRVSPRVKDKLFQIVVSFLIAPTMKYRDSHGRAASMMPPQPAVSSKPPYLVCNCFRSCCKTSRADCDTMEWNRRYEVEE